MSYDNWKQQTPTQFLEDDIIYVNCDICREAVNCDEITTSVFGGMTLQRCEECEKHFNELNQQNKIHE